MNHLVVTGGNGALARAVAHEFDVDFWTTWMPGHAELDVTDPESIRNSFKSRPVDLLVCAAGMTDDGPISKTTEASWDETLAVNYTGAANCASAVLPRMIQRGCGHIIFISSYSALHPPAGQCAYAAAKAALIGLGSALAAKHGHRGIRVNTVLPGFMETPMTRGVSESRKAEIIAAHFLGRLNTVEAVAGFIRHLHERLPHTSGQVFQLDSR